MSTPDAGRAVRKMWSAGIAGNKFIQKGGSDVGVQAGDEAGARSAEIGLHVRIACAIAPEWIGMDGLPGIVDVAEGQAIVVGNVVVDANQLFPPGSGFRDGCEIRRETALDPFA